ncbi:hypothetical protein H2248_007944 [Termitomyces sp. 'cryptogamus']|nr:hypothetical protein H2248_007944 [Termitomyces sp. 'cryptogamus']
MNQLLSDANHAIGRAEETEVTKEKQKQLLLGKDGKDGRISSLQLILDTLDAELEKVEQSLATHKSIPGECEQLQQQSFRNSTTTNLTSGSFTMTEGIKEEINQLFLDADHAIGRAQETEATNKKQEQLLFGKDQEISSLQLRLDTLDAELEKADQSLATRKPASAEREQLQHTSASQRKIDSLKERLKAQKKEFEEKVKQPRHAGNIVRGTQYKIHHRRPISPLSESDKKLHLRTCHGYSSGEVNLSKELFSAIP